MKLLTVKNLLKLSLLLIVSVVLVISTAKVFPTTEVTGITSQAAFLTYLDKRITTLMDAYQIPGVAIAIIENGETIWSKAYGYADLATSRKMTTDTYLRVQSISKSFTAWGIMKLVEDGIIDLDEPVVNYLNDWHFPESDYATDKMTTRQLLTHTAGMPLGDFYNFYSPLEDVPTLEESVFNEAKLKQEPGTAFFYSNTGFNFLELLIEEVTERDFSEYMQNEILLPLGMEQASFEWSQDLKPEIPLGYRLNGEPVPVYVYPEKGSGGLFATVGDIARFVSAEMPKYYANDEVLSEETIEQLHAPSVSGLGQYDLVFDHYGFGHYLEILDGDLTAISHGGQGTGWMTHYHAVPETGDGIVILTNSQRSWPFIAYLLSDWAAWSGLSSPGMSRIIFAIKILWVIIGTFWFFTFWQTWKILEGVLERKRLFSPFSRNNRIGRSVQFCISLLIFGYLLWAINQDYLFFTSVFPIVSGWMAIALLAAAVILFFSALYPQVTRINQKEIQG